MEIYDRDRCTVKCIIDCDANLFTVLKIRSTSYFIYPCTCSHPTFFYPYTPAFHFLYILLSQRILLVFFLSVSSFGSEIILGEDPEGWVNIFSHLVVIMFCSVIQSCLLFLSSVTSVMTDKTQQQTLIYTGEICWFFFQPHWNLNCLIQIKWRVTALLCSDNVQFCFHLIRMLNFLALMTLFTPKSLSSSFLCRIDQLL